MKKIVISSIIASLALTGCVAPNANQGQGGMSAGTAINTGMVFGKTVFQTAVTNKCHSELSNNKIWSTAKQVLSPEKQNQVSSEVCGCVGYEATQNVTIDQLTVAAVDKNARKLLVANSVANSFSSCYGKFVKF